MRYTILLTLAQFVASGAVYAQAQHFEDVIDRIADLIPDKGIPSLQYTVESAFETTETRAAIKDPGNLAFSALLSGKQSTTNVQFSGDNLKMVVTNMLQGETPLLEAYRGLDTVSTVIRAPVGPTTAVIAKRPAGVGNAGLPPFMIEYCFLQGDPITLSQAGFDPAQFSDWRKLWKSFLARAERVQTEDGVRYKVAQGAGRWVNAEFDTTQSLLRPKRLFVINEIDGLEMEILPSQYHSLAQSCILPIARNITVNISRNGESLGRMNIRVLDLRIDGDLGPELLTFDPSTVDVIKDLNSGSRILVPR